MKKIVLLFIIALICGISVGANPVALINGDGSIVHIPLRSINTVTA